ncbi:uncharacterized protein LOC142769144 [Rhipicephalus microplus]|uniref:uncharacterized protein LOC142769144 n=1 Tax=Rhipicephalus microplus TaxID=6941 RepID=UPI003F6B3329
MLTRFSSLLFYAYLSILSVASFHAASEEDHPQNPCSEFFIGPTPDDPCVFTCLSSVGVLKGLVPNGVRCRPSSQFNHTGLCLEGRCIRVHIPSRTSKGRGGAKTKTTGEMGAIGPTGAHAGTPSAQVGKSGMVTPPPPQRTSVQHKVPLCRRFFQVIGYVPSCHYWCVHKRGRLVLMALRAGTACVNLNRKGFPIGFLGACYAGRCIDYNHFQKISVRLPPVRLEKHDPVLRQLPKRQQVLGCYVILDYNSETGEDLAGVQEDHHIAKKGHYKPLEESRVLLSMFAHHL